MRLGLLFCEQFSTGSTCKSLPDVVGIDWSWTGTSNCTSVFVIQFGLEQWFSTGVTILLAATGMVLKDDELVLG